LGFFQLKQYIKHRLLSKSTAGHGVHSPFVYELVTKILPDKNNSDFKAIELLRRQLLKDQRQIEVTDLGAGSQVMKSKKRKIADIAQYSGKSPKLSRLLYRLVQHNNSQIAIELGTSLGLTTAYLSTACNHVISIEGCPNIAAIAAKNHHALGIKNVEIKVGNFDEQLPLIIQKYPNCNLVFIDGNHTFEATLHYYQLLCSSMPPNSLIIFDDIYWSKEMTRAWDEITNDTMNTLTIDLFYIGLVYLRPDQAKEHFRIKI
jgi:predicted O-methyltransferase YrrM